MATIYKIFNDSDISSTRTLLHESIPITGSIVSGTYSELNIKNYSHNMFQSVYDYPFLSSSSNHIFDVTLGFSSKSTLSSSGVVDGGKKIQVYNQMAQVLSGYDTTGSIKEFDADGDFAAGGAKIKEAIFLNFARLLTKDEIKKGTFSLKLGTSQYTNPFTGSVTVVDAGAASSYKVNSPAGEYGLLYTSSVLNGSPASYGTPVGLVYYQAGVALITGSVFKADIGTLQTQYSGSKSVIQAMCSSSITNNAQAFRNRIANISFNNTTELNSTVYFCRIGNNEYNYSSNPTYMSGSKIRVKNEASDNPVSYITTVGLYSADNELLAVAKLSEPIKKDPSNELILRVRLDY
tara:strand:- start:520 stop:1566 length:1047 start_codon:yes stop_codon:yes gene_type:complete